MGMGEGENLKGFECIQEKAVKPATIVLPTDLVRVPRSKT